LALSVVAARLLTRPTLTLREVADGMRAGASRLGVSEGGDAGVRTTLRWSYEALSPPAQRAFRLAAVHRGFDGSIELLASICDISLLEAQQISQELMDVRLLDQPSPGRYQAHDLVRLFSSEMCAEGEDDSSRQEARARLLGCYRASLAAATSLISGDPRPLEPAAPGVVPMRFDDAMRARKWFAVERPQIVLTLDDLGKHQPGEWEAEHYGRLADALSNLEAALVN
jgi:hypothetical protein